MEILFVFLKLQLLNLAMYLFLDNSQLAAWDWIFKNQNFITSGPSQFPFLMAIFIIFFIIKCYTGK